MKFSYYRLFVEHTTQIELLSDIKRTKKEILEQAFDHNDPIYVNNGKQTFVYKKIIRKGDLIWGKVAKRATVPIEHSAEENFKVERTETWPGVFVLINLSGDSHTGQSIAIEVDKNVFQDAGTQLERLLSMINRVRLKNTSFEIHVNPITHEKDFWKIVDDSAGRIRSLTLIFSAPNLFGAKDEFNKDLRQAQEKYGITDAAFKLENTDNNLILPQDDPFLEQGVSYVAAGGGKFKVTLKGRKTISSDDNVATRDLGEDISIEAAFETTEGAVTFSDKLFSWLKQQK